MAKSNAHFSKLVSSKKFILTPVENSNANSNQSNRNQIEISDSKRLAKKRKREERKNKYFTRKKAAKEKERAQKEEEEFEKQLQAKLSKTENKNYEDLPEEYRKLIGGDMEHTHMVKGLDFNLLRQTKEKIAKQQMRDIEDAYNDTNINEECDDQNIKDLEGDISMKSNVIKSAFAHNIDHIVNKYYCKQQQQNESSSNQITTNTKFCNGMTYKFEVDETKPSVPTELMRSQIGYGIVLDHFDEFEQDNMAKKVCLGYTPKSVIDKVGESLENYKNGNTQKPKIQKKKEKIEKKRTFSKMNEDIEEKKKAQIDDDFDIFADVGRDYVCNPTQDPKRRRVAFMTPTAEKIQKLKSTYFTQSKNGKINESDTKYAAASILKNSLNEAKLSNLKVRRDAMPKLLEDKKKKDNGLRGMLISSGYSNYDDDDEDVEDMRGNDSDDDNVTSNKSVNASKADNEWKTIQDKFGDAKSVSSSIKAKLKDSSNVLNNSTRKN